MNPQPRYLDKTSTQTLREGLAEYYVHNPHVSNVNHLAKKRQPTWRVIVRR
jgi:hypothetical protein